MQRSYNITAAKLDDVSSLVSLINSAYRGDGSRRGWTTEADLLDGIRTDEENILNLIQQPGSTILKYIDNNNEILGCVYLQKKQFVMYLGMLTVTPRLQAQGIGAQLLAAAENFALQQGCIIVEMTVISVRHELIAWYNKKGYNDTGSKKPFPTDNKFGVARMPLEFIILKKNIS